MTLPHSTSSRSRGPLRRWLARWGFALQALALCVALAALAWKFLAIDQVYAGDQADAQAAALTLGIMHPPGYSMFVMGGWLFWKAAGVWMFAAEPARAINLFNILAAGALTWLMMMLCARLTGQRFWSLVAPLLFWANPGNSDLLIMPEVYGFYAALLVGALLAANRLARRPGAGRLALMGLLWGAYCTGRIYNLPLTLAMLALVWTIPLGRWPMRRWARTGIFLAAMALPYIVSFAHLRLQIGEYRVTNYAWSLREDIDVPDSFPWNRLAPKTYHTYWMMTAKQYSGLLNPTLGGLRYGLEGYRRELAGGAMGIIVIFGLLYCGGHGARQLIRRRSRMGIVLIAGTVWEMIFFAIYQPADFVSMMLPLEIYLMALVVAGLGGGRRRRRRKSRPPARWRDGAAAMLGAAAALTLVIWNADPRDEQQFSRVCHARALAAMHPDTAAILDKSLPYTMDFLPFDSTIVTDWSWYGTIAYATIKYERPDVRVIHNLSPETALALLGRQDMSRPVFFYATVNIEEILECVAGEYRFRREGILYYIEEKLPEIAG